MTLVYSERMLGLSFISLYSVPITATSSPSTMSSTLFTALAVRLFRNMSALPVLTATGSIDYRHEILCSTPFTPGHSFVTFCLMCGTSRWSLLKYI